MTRLLIVIAIVVIALGAGLVVLAGRNGERPLTHVEKVVPLASLQK
ncbi:hypothetical protein [Sphingomonas sp. 28-62-20]